MNQVAEGVKASSVIVEFADEYGLNMPIGREVDGVINHNSPVEQAYPRSLAAEKPGHAVHGHGLRLPLGRCPVEPRNAWKHRRDRRAVATDVRNRS
jgi:hypothetical protein